MINSGISPIIIGTGSYVPEKVMTNFDLEKIVDTTNDWIFERSGILERRIARDDETTSDMAAEASRRALADANVDATDIDLVILTSATGDMHFPSTACLLQAKLGLRTNIPCFDLSAACTGFIYALEVAGRMMQSGFYKKVLIASAEKMSAILDWQDRNTCVLFGDGAGAVVLKAEIGELSGVIGSVLGADGTGMDILNMPAGGSAMPPSEQTVKDRLHYVKMDGKEVFKMAVKTMQEKAFEVCELCNINPEQISLLIPHQANSRIIKSVAKRLKIPSEKIFENLEKYGNTSSATIPIALDEARKQGRIKENDYVLFVAFGAGLTWGATLIKWK